VVFWTRQEGAGAGLGPSPTTAVVARLQPSATTTVKHIIVIIIISFIVNNIIVTAVIVVGIVVSIIIVNIVNWANSIIGRRCHLYLRNPYSNF
jgi:hypothetical protein